MLLHIDGDKMVNKLNIYSKEQTDTKLSSKQDRLVSGTNIKTINNQSLLGAGNINIAGGLPNYRNLIINPSANQSIKLNLNSVIIGYCGECTFSITGYVINENAGVYVNISNPNVAFYTNDIQGSSTTVENNEALTLYLTIIDF